MGSTYDAAGVSIARGDAFAARIAGLGRSAIGRLGGFAGGTPLDLSRYTDPVLLSSTDGVGTKLLVASRLDTWNTIGIDLVAMCVNDLAVAGADPIQFLDYIACGRIQEERLLSIVDGIALACEEAGCTLAGGETAEMPGMYGEDDLDLAGFTVGIANRSDMLPRGEEIAAGDIVLGFRSSGVHSNGLSLARAALAKEADAAWKELLKPTRIYVSQIRSIRSEIKAAAHVTGGGLEGNLSRVVPEGLCARLTWDWDLPLIFERIMRAGSVEMDEMRRVFNMGIGVALIVAPERVETVTRSSSEELVAVGEIRHG